MFASAPVSSTGCDLRWRYDFDGHPMLCRGSALSRSDQGLGRGTIWLSAAELAIGLTPSPALWLC